MKMNYFVVGTNDMEAAAAFYDALFEGRRSPNCGHRTG
jgi:predicted enzyme related to lactoylglutathione lyase